MREEAFTKRIEAVGALVKEQQPWESPPTAHNRKTVLMLDSSWHPLVDGNPPMWASGWGSDENGIFTEITIEDVIQELRWIPRGSFLMGSPEDEAGRMSREGPQQHIIFEQGFWLFDTVVPQQLWQAVMGGNPSKFTDDPMNPVEKVSWHDAQKFIGKVNDRLPGLHLSLPSEAQWEYACRAGSSTPFDPSIAKTYQGQSITPDEVNYNGNYPYGDASKGEYRKKTVPVKEAGFKPNALGLWHMHGNVWEWCADAWVDTLEGTPQKGEPRAIADKNNRLRVVRGGSWIINAGDVRSAIRYWGTPDFRDGGIGFRCCASGLDPTNS